MRAALLVLAALLLSGCFGGEQDLSLVCERKTGSPWHPYEPAFVLERTTYDTDWTLTQEGAMAHMEAVARHLLTPGGRPYVDFSANISGEPSAPVFQARGEWRDGDRSGVDHYLLALAETPDGVRVLDPVVRAPAWVMGLARAAANDTPELEDLRARDLRVAGSWDPDLPGCVRLAYHEDGPAEGVSLPLAVVHVNLHQERVVSVQRADA